MNFLFQGFRNLSSDRETDMQTDTTESIYHTASRVVKNSQYMYILTICWNVLSPSLYFTVVETRRVLYY